jgi:hypothetical protein
MVPSSNSDCSSEAGFSCASETEDGEAEEWAAGLVAFANESMDNDVGLFGRDRSVSDSSDSSSSTNKLSKSPVGFWHVRPGSSSLEDESDDDEPICWTPSLTSSNHPGTLLNDVGPTHILPQSGFSTSNLSKLLNESGAEFSLDNNSQTNPDDDEAPDTPADQFGNFSFRPLSNKTLVRSMSYTAFSTYSDASNSQYSKFTKSSNIRSSLSSTQENDLFRTYFMKFFDLLVVRETERLIHCRAS